MPLARDPDTLRVPAFMRKRNLRTRLLKPLILTALDRKKAGITLKKRKKAPRKRKLTKETQETFSAPLLDFYAESFTELAVPKKSAPSPSLRQGYGGLRRVGTVTHYYEKIRVGVIKLSGTISVGDGITYETDEGHYEQIVESMEINRQPVFKAGRGKEIGLKLRKKPRIGGSVCTTNSRRT